MRWSPVVLVLALGCALHPAASDSLEPPGPAPEEAPAASPRKMAELSGDLDEKIRTWFEHNGARRLYVQLDRPMYRPGESIWLKTWVLQASSLAGIADGMQVELVDPRGQTVETKQVYTQGSGTASNDFVLASDAPGGKWTVRATAGGETLERDFVVAAYEPPRIDKELDFVREAYGAGERVEALVELNRNGTPLAGKEVKALLQVAGETVSTETLTTDDTGAVLVSAVLPGDLRSGDGLLTVLVEDGGVTESISRSVPIVLADVQLAFYPEGGDLVTGLPGRVYFEGKDRHGEPADLEGHVTDDQGRKVATFSSLHDGLGRFAFTPQEGRSYTAHVTAPAGIDATFPLPAAQESGCALRAYDDPASRIDATRVAVRCTRSQDVIVTGVLREQTVDTAVVRAGPTSPAIVWLDGDDAIDGRQGAMRVTVFDTDRNPLAERLVYRNHGRDLKVSIEANRETYGPRDEVVLDIRTTTPDGEPAAAELALAVVDDGVLTLADDEEGHILSRLYLDPELVDPPEDPGWYFDPDEADAAVGIDLVMGTRGWRRFEWAPVWTFVPAVAVDTGYYRDYDVAMLDDFSGAAMEEGMAVPARQKRPLLKRAMQAPMMEPMARAPMPMAPMAPMEMPVAAQPPMPIAAPAVPMADPGPMDLPVAPPHRPMAGGALAKAKRMDAEHEMGRRQALGDVAFQMQQAVVRVFPKPDYSDGFSGVRSDFRDTVHWEPTVQTDAKGKAQVRFYLSDALTQFRVTAEGVQGGFAGRGETTVKSVLPVSLETKLPVAVSAGDRLDLPITVSNSREKSLDVRVQGDFASALLKVERNAGDLRLGAGASDTFWMPLVVGEGSETTKIRLSVEGGGLSDTVERELTIVPPGFPRAWSAAGELESRAKHTLQVDAFVEGSLTARVSWQPSTVSTLIEGMEGMIREPGGCFEQTSSTNWPNVAILNYLEAHEGDPRLKVQSARHLQVGYDRLTGYQVASGGFETFGNGPGKEVLSAFGLLQFDDMSNVFPVDRRVLDQDIAYLLSQRDGKGGFNNSGESSHGYGSAPKPVLDGFITWSLVSTGHARDLGKELEHQANVAKTTKDPYVLALAARSLLGAEHPMARKAVERLAALQDADGSFPGAESSITRSYEANLLVESTALAALALMDVPGNTRAADKAADWLVQNRRGAGTWGATQATALALGALTRHAEVSRRPRRPGHLSVEVNGKNVGQVRYEPDQEAPIEITGLESALHRGANEIVLRHDGGDPLPYTIDVQWTSVTPDSAPDAELSVETRLDRTRAKMGETVRLTAEIANRTGDVVPSPIARIGLPAGLEPQVWQLEQLQERGEIAFFETRPREVTLYWEGVHAKASHEVALDLIAAVPGRFTGPASSAYPYYDDDEKAWKAGLEVQITR